MLVINKEDLEMAIIEAKSSCKDSSVSLSYQNLLVTIIDGLYKYLCETVPVIDIETGEKFYDI